MHDTGSISNTSLDRVTRRVSSDLRFWLYAVVATILQLCISILGILDRKKKCRFFEKHQLANESANERANQLISKLMYIPD